MADLIRFAMMNFTLTLLIFGLIASAMALLRAPRPWTPAVVIEALFAYFLLFSIAISNFYNFGAHVFFGDVAARMIGWAQSPFQAEVGYASLGFAVVGLLAFFRRTELRIAAIVGPACFLWGAAVGHVLDILRTHNMAPGNAGVILYTDVLIPLLGFLLLWLQHRHGARAVTVTNGG
ncbi:hypothetical protein A9404_10790 [Halothiobacillus diazotrophicus]|uniref:Uncharacterized protein n=1 Tax=Halothiobacillus diazotrophicus TaxID=1860122 RepID=A0A191ZIU0_9GAMM|nr:DUF6790 family protein [Halothiobacillus diazotrophicus]ANJ67799.1 hypothetical protein A9404_10790 [Halothiobacillus diazotrophicus]